MAKTLDNALFGVKNFMIDFCDASTPRETFGIEGYKEFIRESSNISDERTRNKIRYNSCFGKVEDEFYKKSENFGLLDVKRDKALERLNSVDWLVEEGKKYISNLDRLADDYSILAFNKESEILSQKEKLSSLKEQYGELKARCDVVKQEKVTNVDKVRNVFYSIFNKNKVKTTESEESFVARVDLKNEINSFENKIKYNLNFLKKREKEFNKLNKKIKSARRESWKVSSFLENSDNIKNFYKNYMNGSREELFPIKDDKPSAHQHVEEVLRGIGTNEYIPSLKLKNYFAQKNHNRKIAIDNFVVNFFDGKFGIDLNELADNVVASKNSNVSFEVEDRRNFKD